MTDRKEQQGGFDKRRNDDEYRQFVRETWEVFRQDFPTEEACWHLLINRMRQLDLLRCHYCNYCDVEIERELRTYFCLGCRKRSWLTSGTIFHRVRKLHAWLAAIWLFEHGVIISSNWFSSLAGIAQSSALKIFHSIFQVLDSTTSSGTADIVSLPSLLFQPIFTKRSLMTPRCLHPADEEKLEREKFGKQKNTNAEPQDAPQHSENEPSFTLDEAVQLDAFADSNASPSILEPTLINDEMIVMELLKDAPKNFDELLENARLDIPALNFAITDLEMSGFITSLPGGKFKRLEEPGANTNQQSPPNMTKTLSIAPFKDNAEESLAAGINDSLPDLLEAARLRFMMLIRTHFQGISRKYLGLYLALRNFLNLEAQTSDTKESWSGRRGQSEIFDLCLLSRSLQNTRNFVTDLQTKFHFQADPKQKTGAA